MILKSLSVCCYRTHCSGRQQPDNEILGFSDWRGLHKIKQTKFFRWSFPTTGSENVASLCEQLLKPRKSFLIRKYLTGFHRRDKHTRRHLVIIRNAHWFTLSKPPRAGQDCSKYLINPLRFPKYVASHIILYEKSRIWSGYNHLCNKPSSLSALLPPVPGGEETFVFPGCSLLLLPQAWGWAQRGQPEPTWIGFTKPAWRRMKCSFQGDERQHAPDQSTNAFGCLFSTCRAGSLPAKRGCAVSISGAFPDPTG